MTKLTFNKLYISVLEYESKKEKGKRIENDEI